MSHGATTGTKVQTGSSIAKWTLWSLAAFVLILWLQFAMPTQKNSSVKNDTASQSESKKSEDNKAYPDQYSVNYYLRFGQETIVDVPWGFSYDIPPDGPNENKVYQMAVNDGEFHLTGSGIAHQNQGEYVTHFRLKADKKQTGITVYFKRK